MRTVVRGTVSPTADEATVSALNQRSRVSHRLPPRYIYLSARLQIFNYGASLYTKSPQGSNLALFRTASAAVTAVFSILILVAEKKFPCLNRG